ncbi:MAG TPA: hypothetical protein VIR30_09290, partial [Nocardioides sp.]
VLVLLALGLVAFGPAPSAFACDEPTLPFDRQVSRAEHIFTGTVTTSRIDPAQGGARRIYLVKIDKVHKGDGLEQSIRVASSTRSADCGLGKVTSGDKLTFFVGAVKGNNYVEALSNEGTRAASSELDSRIVAELAPKSAGTDVEVKLTRVDDGEAPSITRAIAPGLIVAMLGVVALVVGRLFGRPKPH